MRCHRLTILKDKIIHGNAHDDAGTLALAHDLICDESLELWERLDALQIFDKIVGNPIQSLYSMDDIRAYQVEVSR